MGERYGVTGVLVEHFFRRFFDNDTVQVDGDTQTTVVRAVSAAAVPGLMVAFFLQNQYWRSPEWVGIEGRYFFVLLSFVVMGVVTIFEWEMLFPDRMDFLILTPLSLRPMQMLGAKAAALVGFLGLFLVGCNGFGALVLPAVGRGNFVRGMVAHGVAVGMAGVFSALLFLAVGGVMVCVLDEARFRVVSPVVRTVSVMALVLLALHYAMYGDAMQALLAEPLGRARWLPPLWFLGVYERLMRGEGAPAFAVEMARDAVRGTMVAAGVVLVTYPVAWARVRARSAEGGSGRRGEPWRWVTEVVHRVVRRPGERAVFHFIGQTMRRNNRYQVYLAMYCGSGLALAVGAAVRLRVVDGAVRVGWSERGLHAVMPLLLFWVIAGVRTAFAFPLNLTAGWVFRVTGVRAEECSAAAWRWVIGCGLATVGCVVGWLAALGWDGRRLLVQAVCGVCLCVALTDGFFFAQRRVPFNQPRMPGRVSFPLMLTLYVGVFPLFVLGMVRVAMGMEQSLREMGLVMIVAGVIHGAVGWLREGEEESEEEMEGYEGEFQVLGLG